MDILYGHGISREGDLVDFGAQLEIVEKSGSWFSFEGERLGQGRDNACRLLKENPQTCNRIEAAIRAKVGLPARPEVANKDVSHKSGNPVQAARIAGTQGGREIGVALSDRHMPARNELVYRPVLRCEQQINRER